MLSNRKERLMARTWVVKLLLVAVFSLVVTVAGVQLYAHRHFDVPIVAGPGVTRVEKLSKYCPSLKGTAGDTNVFFLESGVPGGTALLIASTHANEVAAALTGFVLVENAVPDQGTLIIIPVFNNSGSRGTWQGDGYPLYFSIETLWGEKKFRMGGRGVSQVDQWPDPDVFVHFPERQLLSYIDARNTNRTWPGRENGVLAERVCYAAMELIRQENVDVAIDLHGAETMFPVTNCIVAPERSVRIAAMAALTVQMQEGFANHVELSPKSFHGLSHREIADYSDAYPFLLEAPIPFLDQPTGPKTVDLLLSGQDEFLLSLSEQKRLFVPYTEEGWPIEKRVGQHCSVSLEIFKQFTKQFPKLAISLSNAPKYAELIENGVGYYLHDPSLAATDRIYYE
jgi:predicted deacylase